MGFIKIDRELLQSDFWLREPFTYGQAWVDLIGLANWAEKDKFFRHQHQKVKRGQLVTSQQFLAERWKWSRTKVRTYLRNLERAGMVTTESTTNYTTVTIEKYALYQDKQPTKGQQNNQLKTNARPTESQLKDTQEEYKEEKERKNIYTPAAKTEEKKNASSLREDYGGVWLTPAEYDELEASVTDKMAFLDVLDRVGEWLQDNPRQQNRHKSVVKTFLRNDGLI